MTPTENSSVAKNDTKGPQNIHNTRNSWRDTLSVSMDDFYA